MPDYSIWDVNVAWVFISTPFLAGLDMFPRIKQRELDRPVLIREYIMRLRKSFQFDLLFEEVQILVLFILSFIIFEKWQALAFTLVFIFFVWPCWFTIRDRLSLWDNGLLSSYHSLHRSFQYKTPDIVTISLLTTMFVFLYEKWLAKIAMIVHGGASYDVASNVIPFASTLLPVLLSIVGLKATLFMGLSGFAAMCWSTMNKGIVSVLKPTPASVTYIFWDDLKHFILPGFILFYLYMLNDWFSLHARRNILLWIYKIPQVTTWQIVFTVLLVLLWETPKDYRTDGFNDRCIFGMVFSLCYGCLCDFQQPRRDSYVGTTFNKGTKVLVVSAINYLILLCIVWFYWYKGGKAYEVSYGHSIIWDEITGVTSHTRTDDDRLVEIQNIIIGAKQLAIEIYDGKYVYSSTVSSGYSNSTVPLGYCSAAEMDSAVCNHEYCARQEEGARLVVESVYNSTGFVLGHVFDFLVDFLIVTDE